MSYLILKTCKIFAHFISRVTQQREAEHEIDQKTKELEAKSLESVTPKVSTPPKPQPSQSEAPKEVDMTPESIGTPVSTKLADNATDSSPATSTISAGSVTPSHVKRRGRPCKIVTKPDYSDFPVGGTYEEQDHWFRAKHTQRWQYNILTSDQEAAFRARENEHMSNYYHNKKVTTEGRPHSQRASANESTSGEKDNLDGIDVLDVEDSSHSIAQEKS